MIVRRRRRERRHFILVTPLDPGPPPLPTWRPPSLTIGPTFINLIEREEGQQSSNNSPICINIWYQFIFLCFRALFSRMTNKFSSDKSQRWAEHWLSVRLYVMASRQFGQVSGYIWSKFVPAAQFIFGSQFGQSAPRYVCHCPIRSQLGSSQTRSGGDNVVIWCVPFPGDLGRRTSYNVQGAGRLTAGTEAQAVKRDCEVNPCHVLLLSYYLSKI